MPADKRHILEQIERLMNCEYFPTGGKERKSYVSELHRVLSRANTEAIVTAVLDAWLESRTARPTVADIAALVIAKNVDAITRPRCPQCDGAGFISQDRLVTYHDGTYRVKGSVALVDAAGEPLNALAAHEFRQKLGRNQDIQGAAVPCSCLPSTHPDSMAQARG